MSAVKETIKVCPQCNRKNIAQEEDMCDSCMDIGNREAHLAFIEMDLPELIKAKGKAYVQNIINKY